jgi:hypothetical protein
VSYEDDSEWTVSEAEDWARRVTEFEGQAQRLAELLVHVEHLRRTCEKASLLAEEVLAPWIEAETEVDDLDLPTVIGLACSLDELSKLRGGEFCNQQELEDLSAAIAAVLLLEGER